MSDKNSIVEKHSFVYKHTYNRIVYHILFTLILKNSAINTLVYLKSKIQNLKHNKNKF